MWACSFFFLFLPLYLVREKGRGMKVKPKCSTLSHLVEAAGCLGEEVTYCDGCF